MCIIKSIACQYYYRTATTIVNSNSAIDAISDCFAYEKSDWKRSYVAIKLTIVICQRTQPQTETGQYATAQSQESQVKTGKSNDILHRYDDDNVNNYHRQQKNNIIRPIGWNMQFRFLFYEGELK